MKKKTIGRASFVAAVVAALGMTVTASPALARSAAWCPQQIGEPCKKTGKQPVLKPGQAKPKIRPAQVKDAYGNTVFRSGSWEMS